MEMTARTMAPLMLLRLLCLATVLLPYSCHGLYAEEAGQLDFVVATAGHGATRFAMTANKQTLITSDATAVFGSKPTSCLVAARNLETGTHLWRRHVCSTTTATTNQRRHVVVGNAERSLLVTLDATGHVRSWNVLSGALEWEAFVTELDLDDAGISLSTADSESNELVVVEISGMDSGPTVLLDASNGQVIADTKSLGAALVQLSSYESNAQQVTCPRGVTVALDPKTNDGGILLTKDDKSDPVAVTLQGLNVTEQGGATGVFGVACPTTSQKPLSFVVATARQTTSLVTLNVAEATVAMGPATVQWTTEEGLSSIGSALLLDVASHLVHEDDTEEDNADEQHSAQHLLSFAARLSMHSKMLQETASNVASLLLPSSDADEATSFGFSKMAVLLSSQSHRLYGMPTSGPKRGLIQYTLHLPYGSTHRLVHGAPNAAHSVRGIGGKSHSPRDVLVVSYNALGQVSWMCVDGTTGTVHSDGRLGSRLTAPVAQVVPLGSTVSSSPCRQGALLVLDDLTTVSLPHAKDGPAQVAAATSAAAKGFFAHRLVRGTAASLEALSLSSSANNHAEVRAHVSGVAQFPGESLVAVAYPPRDEVIQSPCNVLGDQSLLLKYLNPHLVVLVTMTTQDDDANEKDAYTAAFAQASGQGDDKRAAAAAAAKQKRKPTGAGQDAAAAAEPTTPTTTTLLEQEPNLFVNVVDTVSGRVLYRASHANAATTSKVAVLVSENWIFYAYTNTRTRRSELGVLSLYEGMVDSKGLTAFAAPDQLTHFSSLHARESRPVVLAKTFSVAPHAVTALGVTRTRGGISGKRLIVATAAGQVYQLDRKLLEPRRPLGPVKEAEKLEGLRQYSELIPLVTYASLSHTQMVQGVTAMTSAPTDLESQTVILAYGGPDLFVVRTSPSRGFDLLPDSFSRLLLSVIVVALIGVFLLLQRVVFRKTVQKGWA